MSAPHVWVSMALHISKTIAASELFDKGWYRRYQMRGLTKLTNPLWHFLAVGRKHQLDPSPLFDTAHYISSNPDVRDSNLNPLFHYLEYGFGERRQPIRSVQETFDHLFPDARELSTFLTPRVPEPGLTGQGVTAPRLTVVIDQATMTRPDLTLAQVLDLSGTEAGRRSCELRVISLLADNTQLIDQLAELSLSRRVSGLDIVTAPPHRETTHYEAHEDEIFVGTSWTSAAAIRHAAKPANQWFLGAKGLEANNRKLWRRLSLGSVLAAGQTRQNEMTMAVSTGPARAGSSPTLGIIADVASSPEMYAWALTELEMVLCDKPSLVDRISIALVGDSLRPVNFLHSITALVTPRFADSGTSFTVFATDLVEEGSLARKLHAVVLQGVSDD
ncbi:MAG: hypothetical protein F2621_02460 [Actinobacteria bacterium]|uniref:Unannotated protein n=1 Tax=freshwater metagenome TaxID=449393 RepID=A0A6J6JW35_9ZZZZ|nr:hypothetical protein [Actinomycetota bacterium]